MAERLIRNEKIVGSIPTAGSSRYNELKSSMETTDIKQTLNDLTERLAKVADRL